MAKVFTTSAASGSPAPATPAAPSGPGHAEGVSNEEFRAAMSRLAAGVVLVTAHDPEDGPRGEDAGMTATAFVSVSLDPPLVMVSVRTGSRMDDVLTDQPLWAVSLLGEDQRDIAGRFAMSGRLSDSLLFASLPHTRGAYTGAPLVEGGLGAVECRTEQRVRAGDHTLLIGRVLSAALPSAEGGPLVYYRGRYRHLGR
ncbi:reductase [Streptomyces gougerotii]|uniref:Reductase n=2 Tax=Streptomyces diastaticus group TaxID=2849069 RepID=A0A8H9HQS2_9ACTN|nr:NADH-dependent flavin reductase [Streptomyces sp. ADI98-12]GFH64241.1 reductase [Streptomyces rutgersensis]GFH78154.1 reductase [Streptomyces gougerotii]GGU80235.1 reductase [Streptomyces gougerotii]